MSDSKKSFMDPLFSAGGLILVFFILIAINIVFSAVNVRLDLTKESQYSLSQSTKKIISDMKTDVVFKVFYTKDNPGTPSYIKNYAKRAINFLREYERQGKGAITLEIYDPKPDSEEEEWAERYGVRGIDTPGGERLWLGLAVMAAEREETIPFMDPAEETRLEYNVTRMITRIQSPEKQKIGLLSRLPVFGMRSSNPAGQRKGPWMFVEELKKTYEVTPLSPDGENIPDDLDLLMLVNPEKVGDAMIRQVDDYVSKGGNVLAFIDPHPMADPSPFQRGASAALFDDLLASWGVAMEKEKILADFNYSTLLSRGNNQQEDNLLWLSLQPEAFNPDHLITARLETMLLPTAGVFNKKMEGSSFAYEPLLSSTVNSALVENFQVRLSTEDIRNMFKSGEKRRDLAATVRGRFPKAFGSSSEDIVEKDMGKATAPKESVIVLVGDSDMLYDPYYLQRQNFLGFQTVSIFNDNLNFLLNAAEMLCGNESLIDIRSRGEFRKPFDRVLRLQEEARMKWLDRERELIRKVEELNGKLGELEGRKNESQKFIISASQEHEVEKFKEQRRQINRELKDVRKNLRSEIESLGRKVKFFNIFFAPILIGIAGLFFAISRRRRMREQKEQKEKTS